MTAGTIAGIGATTAATTGGIAATIAGTIAGIAEMIDEISVRIAAMTVATIGATAVGIAAVTTGIIIATLGITDRRPAPIMATAITAQPTGTGNADIMRRASTGIVLSMITAITACATRHAAIVGFAPTTITC